MRKVLFLLSMFATLSSYADYSDHGRILDEDTSSSGSVGFAVILGIIFVIVGGYFYFNLKDSKTGERDQGCGCLVLLALGAVILGLCML